MNIEQLYYLIEIADSGSISEAAKNLHLSQPNMSKSLSNLEKELKTKIFTRSRTGTSPTKSGKLIIEQAREIVLQIERMDKIAKEQSSLITGSLSIGAIASFTMSLLPSILNIFKVHFPEVHINIMEAGSIRIEENVINGKVDIGLVVSFDPMIKDDILEFEPLLTAKTMVCVGKSSDLAQKKSISLQEIVKYPIITFNNEYRMNSFLLNFIKGYTKPNLHFSVENSEAAKKIISHGIAVGFYSEIALKTDPYVTTGEIVPLPISTPETSAYFGVLKRKDVRLSFLSEKFLKELRVHTKKFRSLYNLP